MSSAPTQNCIHCGSEIAMGALTCPYCRGGQTPGSAPAVFPRVKVRSRYVYEERPAGVTALAVFVIFLGALSFALIPVIGSAAEATPEIAAEDLPHFKARMTGVLVTMGVVGVAVGVGLLLLHQWARITGVVLAGASAALGVVRIVAHPSGIDGYGMVVVGGFIGIYLIAVGPYFGKRAVRYVAKAPRR